MSRELYLVDAHPDPLHALLSRSVSKSFSSFPAQMHFLANLVNKFLCRFLYSEFKVIR